MRHRLTPLAAVSAAIALAVAFALAPAAAQQTTKQQDIERLIEITNMDQVVVQLNQIMTPQINKMILQMRPDISKENLEMLMTEYNALFEQSVPNFIDAIVPIYERRFTQNEIRDIIAFYETPTGQKTLAELPGLMAEGMQVGQQWGQAIARAAAQRIQQRIVELGI